MRQAQTAIDVYHDRDRKRRGRSQELVILAVLACVPDATIKEIAVATGIVDSTVIARLHELMEKGKVDNCAPKRACAVNGIRKQPWRKLGPSSIPLQRPLFVIGGRR